MKASSLTSAAATAQYATSLLAKKNGGTAGATSPDAVAKQLQATTHDHKTLTAQHALDKQQAALATELRGGLAKAGVKLAGEVDFSVASDGSVAVKGSDADKAAVTAFLKKDATNPSLQSRLGSALKAAQALSATAQQTNAISMAARHGGAPGNVMAMYTSFMGHKDSTPAVLSLSAATSSLAYPGMLNSQG
jgi:alkyl sulfatase BDS1-like metallo-beta-lactamase superfamily hydrolase